MEMIGTALAAEILQLSESQTRRLALAGRISNAKKISGRWVYQKPIEVIPPSRLGEAAQVCPSPVLVGFRYS